VSEDFRSRRLYLDWARGVAVLLMIEAHTLDAWTRLDVRATPIFRNLQIVGGLAAPLFLWLAGVGVVMSAAGTARRSGRAAGVEKVFGRGLEIFILAFLFRLQAFLVSPGSHPVTLFRVDILNIMGPSMAVAAVIWGLVSTPATLVTAYAALACAIAMLTPIVRVSALVGRLPLWIQWYVRPFGDLTMFTVFPWAGFVFAGAACGVLLAARPDKAERHLHAWLALAGVGVLAFGDYTASLPSIYRQSSFWTSSPTFFAIRVGVLLAVVSAIYALAQVLEARGVVMRPLARLGRDSLFVYWIHVELVYGYATWPVRHRLPVIGTLIAYGLFTALVYAAVIGKDRLIEARRTRGSRVDSPQIHLHSVS
jgi:uncharacterized membrane protein